MIQWSLHPLQDRNREPVLLLKPDVPRSLRASARRPAFLPAFCPERNLLHSPASLSEGFMRGWSLVTSLALMAWSLVRSPQRRAA
jgi:hypothetical protein